MQKTLPLYHGPSVIGSVVLSSENGMLSAVAKTYASISGICRAYIKGNDANLLIGVLSPDGSAFRAERTFSRAALSSQYINPEELTYAYVLCKQEKASPSEWRPASDISGNPFENKIAATLIKASGALCDDILLPRKIAVPLFTGHPFPRPDILCIVSPERIGGTLFGVITVDSAGNPENPD